MFASECKVGFYVEAKRVYVAEVTKQFGQITLLRHGHKDWDGSEASSLSEAVKKVTEETGISTHDASIALPDHEVMMRHFEMPIVPRRERAEAVRFESHRYMPFDTRDLYYDFDAVEDKKKKTMKVVFVAARKALVERTAAVFTAAGVRIRAAESASFSMMRALELEQQKKFEFTHALVQIDAQGILNLVIARDGSVLMTRQSPLAAGPEATPSLETLLSELRLSFNYFSKNFKAGTIREITFFDHSEKGRPEWAQAIQREFGTPVKAKNPARAVLRAETSEAGLAIAVGVALRGVAGGRLNRMNLARSRAAGAPLDGVDRKKHIEKTVLMELAVLCALFLLAYSAVSLSTASERRALARVQQAVAHPENVSPDLSLDELIAIDGESGTRSHYLTSLVKNRVLWTLKMSEIAKITPADIRLSLLHASESEDTAGRRSLSLKLEGVVLRSKPGGELEVINRLAANLRESSEFMRGLEEVKILSIQKAAASGSPVSFTLLCRGQKQ